MNLDDLEAKAMAATPGPWGRIGYPYYEYWIVEKHEAEMPAPAQVHPIATVAHAPCKYADGWYKNTQREANAAFIASAHPQVVLALVRVARAAEKHVDNVHAPTPALALCLAALRSRLSVMGE